MRRWLDPIEWVVLAITVVVFAGCVGVLYAAIDAALNPPVLHCPRN